MILKDSFWFIPTVIHYREAKHHYFIIFSICTVWALEELIQTPDIFDFFCKNSQCFQQAFFISSRRIEISLASWDIIFSIAYLKTFIFLFFFLICIAEVSAQIENIYRPSLFLSESSPNIKNFRYVITLINYVSFV